MSWLICVIINYFTNVYQCVKYCCVLSLRKKVLLMYWFPSICGVYTDSINNEIFDQDKCICTSTGQIWIPVKDHPLAIYSTLSSHLLLRLHEGGNTSGLPTLQYNISMRWVAIKHPAINFDRLLFTELKHFQRYTNCGNHGFFALIAAKKLIFNQHYIDTCTHVPVCWRNSLLILRFNKPTYMCVNGRIFWLNGIF